MKPQSWGIITSLLCIVTIWSTFITDYLYHDANTTSLIFGTFVIITIVLGIKALATLED